LLSGTYFSAEVGSIAPIYLTITNIIDTPIQIEDITSSNSEFSVTGPVAQILDPNESYDVRVVFSPTLEGLQSTDIRVFTDVSDDTLVSFAGTGILVSEVVPAVPFAALAVLGGFLILLGMRRYHL
jgi:hypothetical protein